MELQTLSQGLALLIIIAVTLIPSLVIASMTSKSISCWYQTLKKPRWNPPNWLFGPVWTVLYLSMSVAMWLVWKEEPGFSLPLRLYAAQLLLNHAWSPTFFLLRRPKWAFFVIVCLWLTIVATSLVFYLKVQLAGQLMIPYLVWVSFAACLNYRIWRDNRGHSKASWESDRPSQNRRVQKSPPNILHRK